MARFLQKVHALCLHGTPATWLKPRTDMEAWRKFSRNERYLDRSVALRWLINCIAGVGYPVAIASAALASYRTLRRNKPEAKTSHLLLIYSDAILRNIPPVEFVFYGFDDSKKRALAAEYLYWIDTPALVRLNRVRGANNLDVQDKERFAAICLQHGFAHVVTVAVTRGGQQVYGAAIEQLELDSYWVKPLSSHAGEGSLGWKYDKGYWHSGELKLSSGKWCEYLLGRDFIVQKHQINHLEIERLSNGLVITLRLTTVCTRAAVAYLIGGSASLPYGKASSSHHAIACRINLATGAIDRALGRGNVAVMVHPDSGASLCGSIFPHWQQCVQLVLQAHQEAFSSFASLGWDVVLTPAGPLLLEANSGWNPLGQQFNFGPLGLSPLGPIVSEELRLLQ